MPPRTDGCARVSPTPPAQSGGPGTTPDAPEQLGPENEARSRRLRRRMRVIYDVPVRSRMRTAVIGVPLPTGALEDELLPKRLALPVFASDALSSVAYATEAALLVLVVASASSAKYVVPVSIAVALLLAIVVASYRQTVHAYPQGGGAYVVASDQLGEVPGLIAAASLLVDYVLTVAVSVAAGILAITSALTWLTPWLLPMSLVAVGVLAMVNLRGLRESGRAFALPTYGFIVLMAITIIIGAIRDFTGTLPHAATPSPVTTGTAATIGILVLLRAFASGCSALTGVEAIANGVQAFRPPQPKNAATTLGLLGVIAIFLFMGVTYLAYATHAMPSTSASVLSQVAAAVWHGPAAGRVGYYLVQIFTFGVLVLAANTAFQGFPRLIGMMAQGNHAPRLFQYVGDRLVYSNGVTALAAISGLLLIGFNASVDNLIHLYLLGVFLAFTLSQVGMVRFWLRKRHEGAPLHDLARKIAINATGAIATGVVLVIILGTKFFEGAWMVTVTIPIIIAFSMVVHRHYRRVDLLKLASPGDAPELSGPPCGITVLVDRLDEGTAAAVQAARLIARGAPVTGLFVGSRLDWERVSGAWRRDHTIDIPLARIPRRDGEGADGVITHLRRMVTDDSSDLLVVLPCHNRRVSHAAFRTWRQYRHLRTRLLRQPKIAVAEMPKSISGAWWEADHVISLVAMAKTSKPSLHAAAVAVAISGDDTSAVHVAGSEDAVALAEEWRDAAPVHLEIIESPYRDLGGPLANAVHDITAADKSAICLLVVPEIVVAKWRFLHNQRTALIRRALVDQERAVLVTVPYAIS
jgi:amino acid transporter